MAEEITSVYGCSDPDRFQPLKADHRAVGEVCPGCTQPLKAGDRPMFVNGKPADEEEAAKEAAGRAFNMEMKLAHQDCAIDAIARGSAVAYR